MVVGGSLAATAASEGVGPQGLAVTRDQKCLLFFLDLEFVHEEC